jgi:hypothetical protein
MVGLAYERSSRKENSKRNCEKIFDFQKWWTMKKCISHENHEWSKALKKSPTHIYVIVQSNTRKELTSQDLVMAELKDGILDDKTPVKMHKLYLE